MNYKVGDIVRVDENDIAVVTEITDDGRCVLGGRGSVELADDLKFIYRPIVAKNLFNSYNGILRAIVPPRYPIMLSQGVAYVVKNGVFFDDDMVPFVFNGAEKFEHDYECEVSFEET